MEKKTRIWIICAIILSAFTTVINISEARWISVILAIVGIGSLAYLFVKQDKKGFYIMCACYLLSFLYSAINSLGNANVVIYIIMSLIGSSIIPGITWLFVSKDKELNLR